MCDSQSLLRDVKFDPVLDLINLEFRCTLSIGYSLFQPRHEILLQEEGAGDRPAQARLPVRAENEELEAVKFLRG